MAQDYGDNKITDGKLREIIVEQLITVGRIIVETILARAQIV